MHAHACHMPDFKAVSGVVQHTCHMPDFKGVKVSVVVKLCQSHAYHMSDFNAVSVVE